MTKYGDEHKCTCEMDMVTAINNYHATTCDLWNDPNFANGEDEWDGDLGCLVLNRSPWHNADEYIWDGDSPVVRKSTAAARTFDVETQHAITEWASLNKDDAEVDLVGDLEQEVLDALTAGTATVEDTGLVALPNGSYADFESRITWRKIMGDDGQPTWAEESWDWHTGDQFISEGPGIVEEDPVDCECMPPKRFYCNTCKVQRKTEADVWSPWTPNTTTGTSGTVYNSTYSWHRCNHTMDAFKLPGGQHENIKISAKRTHTPSTTPDYGLYLYNGWDPKCVATLLPWQDYGLPTVSYEKAAEAIKYAYDLATVGRTVEVGCMGGHGRTGTVLACMAILSKPDMSPEDAVLWVRKVHCNEAIETNQQEWFVKWFAAWHLGTTCPPMPTTYVTKHSANWQAAGTAATAVAGGAGAALPKAPYQGFGSRPGGVWCDECKRTVITYHNGSCSKDVEPQEQDEQAHVELATLMSMPNGAMSGTTANARRRNAKRANRRNARRLARTGD